VKSKWENESDTLLTRIEIGEQSVSLLGSEFQRKITDSSSGSCILHCGRVYEILATCTESSWLYVLSTPEDSSSPSLKPILNCCVACRGNHPDENVGASVSLRQRSSSTSISMEQHLLSRKPAASICLSVNESCSMPQVPRFRAQSRLESSKFRASSISVLAKEFWLDDLLSECSALQMASRPELIAASSERIPKLFISSSSSLSFR
jgi:hypothetical protein